MNNRVNDTLVAWSKLIASPPVFRMAPPVQVAAEPHVPPFPVIVKLPVACVVLVQTIPLVGPLAEIDKNVKLPSEFAKLTAVELPVFMRTPFTVRPVAPFAESVPASVGVLAVFPGT